MTITRVNTNDILDLTIINADVSDNAAIADTKLATIQTPGKVVNSATTGTPFATPDTLALRDTSGNCTFNSITANQSVTANVNVKSPNIVATSSFVLSGPPNVEPVSIFWDDQFRGWMSGLYNLGVNNTISAGSIITVGFSTVIGTISGVPSNYYDITNKHYVDTAIADTTAVHSVDVSGGTTGLTFTGGPIIDTGTITMGGILDITSGGTGEVTANEALNALLPAQGSSAGKVLGTDGVNTSWIAMSGGGGGGSVTSVAVSGGTTGLTTSGGPITTFGTITLEGTLAIANGGTGSTSAGAAIVALGGVPTSRSIATTAPLTGGGDLSVDRTLAITAYSGTSAGAVPAWVSGTKALQFLCADGTWVPPGASVVLVRTVSTSGAINVTTDSCLLVDATAGPVTVTLPAISATNVGKSYQIKKIDATTNSVTLQASGADTIDGSVTMITVRPKAAFSVVRPDTGTDWGVF